jgi:two-component system chemotaxis response regulator CheY
MKKEVVVCVDDEEGVLRVLRAQLGARFGHECQVLTARSGDEAVALFDELEREGEAIAVVIADQIMPGMKGVELLEIVDRRLPATTKILLTGQAGLDAVIDGINRAHLNQYVSKPWDETHLLLAVENLLRQYRLVHENQQLIASLSAKNQALLEMNRELEAKIHERTHEHPARAARGHRRPDRPVQPSPFSRTARPRGRAQPAQRAAAVAARAGCRSLQAVQRHVRPPERR